MFNEERRKGPRFPFHSKGEIRINHLAFRGRLIDFSQFGALFESGIVHVGLERGEKCSLDILQLNDRALCSIDGHIMHHQESLIGIQFIELDQERLSRMLEIGSLNLAPPELLDRKLGAMLYAA